MIRYVGTTGPGSDAANLSREGSWGNRPYPNDAAARAAAHDDARGALYTITQTAIRRQLRG